MQAMLPEGFPFHQFNLSTYELETDGGDGARSGRFSRQLVQLYGSTNGPHLGQHGGRPDIGGQGRSI